MAEVPNPLETDAQRTARELRSEADRVKHRLEVADFKWLLAHKQGRRIVWRLLEIYGVFRSSFRSDPLEMAFLEGQRNDGLRLLADIHEHAPERYAEMLKEKDARHRTRSNDSDSPGSSDDDPGDTAE